MDALNPPDHPAVKGDESPDPAGEEGKGGGSNSQPVKAEQPSAAVETAASLPPPTEAGHSASPSGADGRAKLHPPPPTTAEEHPPGPREGEGEGEGSTTPTSGGQWSGMLSRWKKRVVDTASSLQQATPPPSTPNVSHKIPTRTHGWPSLPTIDAHNWSKPTSLVRNHGSWLQHLICLKALVCTHTHTHALVMGMTCVCVLFFHVRYEHI